MGSNGFKTLEEGMKSGEIVIKDVLGVNEVIIENRGGTRVFAIDGEEILGARQNRILNTDILIQEPREYEVPVSCIEQHRWSGDYRFSGAGYTVTPTLRGILAKTIKTTLEKTQKRTTKDTEKVVSRTEEEREEFPAEAYRAPQPLVWSTVDRLLSSATVHSATSSFHDVYTTFEDQINEYLEDFTTIENAVGFLAFSNNEFIGADIFGTNSLYRKFEKKLLKSYILEGYLRKSQRGRTSIEISPEKLLEKASKTSLKKHKSPTEGELYFGEKEKILLKGFSHSDNFLHLSAFPVTTAK